MTIRPALLRIAFALSLVVAFVAALAPTPDTPLVVEQQDKVGHFLTFMVLGLLGFAAWPRHPRSIVALLLAYGALVELAQSLTTYRQGDLWDWVADALGVAAALLVIALRRRTPGSGT